MGETGVFDYRKKSKNNKNQCFLFCALPHGESFTLGVSVYASYVFETRNIFK